MSRKRMNAIADCLPAIKAGMRRQVAMRLGQGAEIGGAVDGRVIALTADPETGERRKRSIVEYGRHQTTAPSASVRSGEEAASAPEPETEGRRRGRDV